MAPAAGPLHQLLGKQVKLLKYAWQNLGKATQAISRSAEGVLQPVRTTPRQPLHPRALLQQTKSRRFQFNSSSPHQFRLFSSGSAKHARPQQSRISYATTRVGKAIKQSNGRAPFASTLRPNLTGGTLGRTAGGYSLGGGGIGGARYFSHTPTAPAQVIQNVSQAVRALCLSGSRMHYDGVDAITGEKRWKRVSILEDEVVRKTSSIPKSSPGSYVEFPVNPTITAFSSFSSITGFPAMSDSPNTLASEGLMDVLTTDFSRAVKDMVTILNDLKRLADLGDLALSYQGSALRVHFPGCDAETVERLCDDLGIQRGLVRQDEDFDTFVGTEIALLFPFAPSRPESVMSYFEKATLTKPHQKQPIVWENMMSPAQSDSLSDLVASNQSDTGHDYAVVDAGYPWISSPSGYETIRSSDLEQDLVDHRRIEEHSPLEYQGIEGICRFLEHCDSNRR